jgi:hypothetical protein
LIIEGLLTTVADDGQPHVAPMGPVVDPDLQSWLLRPFQSSTTFQYLRQRPNCIFHVVDDVLPIVQNVLGLPDELQYRPHPGGWLIASACSWHHLQVTEWDVSSPRSEARATVQASGSLRPFWGWNRAKHAVLEAAILITRLHLLEQDEVRRQFEWLAVAVTKTAGPRELQAWDLLRERLANWGKEERT